MTARQILETLSLISFNCGVDNKEPNRLPYDTINKSLSALSTLLISELEKEKMEQDDVDAKIYNLAISDAIEKVGEILK